jgi:hypothetical protein
VPFTRSHRPPFLEGPSLSGHRLVGAPRKVAFLACPDEPFPLQSSEVSPQSVVFFPCPDRSLGLPPSAQLIGAPRDVAFFPTQRALARLSPRRVAPMLGLAMWWPFAPAPPSCFAIRPGYCNGGFISPTSRPDAGRALSHGKHSMHDRQCSPSSVRVNA